MQLNFNHAQKSEVRLQNVLLQSVIMASCLHSSYMLFCWSRRIQ